MEFKTYNKAELAVLITSEKFKSFSFLPISVHRAVSQIKNPRARPEDTLLILALEDGALAGYIGILPDDIFPKGEKIHCGWLSTLFVSDDYRGKGVARQLLQKASECYSENILINEFTPEAEALYLKSKDYQYLPELPGKAFHQRFNLRHILPSKHMKWERFRPAISGLDGAVNSFINLFLKGQAKTYEISKFADGEIEKFLKEKTDNGIFCRTPEDINWVAENPWVLPGNKDSAYRFSDYDEEFQFIFFKLYEGEKLSAVALISVRNAIARLQYIFGRKMPEIISNALYNYVAQHKLATLVLYDTETIKKLEERRWLFQKTRSRKYLIHKNFENKDAVIEHFTVSAGDGDSIFT